MLIIGKILLLSYCICCLVKLSILNVKLLYLLTLLFWCTYSMQC